MRMSPAYKCDTTERWNKISASSSFNRGEFKDNGEHGKHTSDSGGE